MSRDMAFEVNRGMQTHTSEMAQYIYERARARAFIYVRQKTEFCAQSSKNLFCNKRLALIFSGMKLGLI